MKRLSVHTYRYEVALPPLPTILTFRVSEDVQLLLYPLHWRRRRGDWPAHWRDSKMPGPVLRYWRCGPLEIRHLRAL